MTLTERDMEHAAITIPCAVCEMPIPEGLEVRCDECGNTFCGYCENVKNGKCSECRASHKGREPRW